MLPLTSYSDAKFSRAVVTDGLSRLHHALIHVVHDLLFSMETAMLLNTVGLQST